MIALSRADKSLLARWWWTVDRWMLLMLMVLALVGLMINLTASQGVAERLGLDIFHFTKKQVVFVVASLMGMLALSLMSDTMIRRIAILGFLGTLVAMVATLFVGVEIKGATRWINVAGFSLQPSEFLKPFFAVTVAWFLSASFADQKLPAKSVSVVLFLMVVGLLMLQPDVGQSLLISAVFVAQLTLAGLPLLWLGIAGAAGLGSLFVAYLTFDHVANRIDLFLDPASGDSYQTRKALESFDAGGLLGKGPGEGSVKMNLPDAHADYIFAVVGEEFGAIAAVVLLLFFAAIVARGLVHLVDERDPFKILAASGLLMQFALQVMINVGVTLAVLPATGMTLPFVSAGGSSLLAMGITMGMVLALTRHNKFTRGYRLAGRPS